MRDTATHLSIIIIIILHSVFEALRRRNNFLFFRKYENWCVNGYARWWRRQGCGEHSRTTVGMLKMRRHTFQLTVNWKFAQNVWFRRKNMSMAINDNWIISHGASIDAETTNAVYLTAAKSVHTVSNFCALDLISNVKDFLKFWQAIHAYY